MFPPASCTQILWIRPDDDALRLLQFDRAQWKPIGTKSWVEELNCLVLKRMVTCLICFSTAHACADMTVVRCHVVDAQGVELLSLKPLYRAKRWSRYRIEQDRFIDLRYNFFTSSVAVRTTEVPHYPWTFSETVIDHGTLTMSGEPTPTGALAIERAKSGAEVMCGEIRSR